VNVEAHCARCDGVEFVQADPGLPMRYINELICCTCGEQVVHGDLIAQLAKEAVQHSRAMTVARDKRQARVPRQAAAQPTEGGGES
jgi:hypothetical protein